MNVKLETGSYDIEGLKKDTLKLSDDVSTLEAERNHVANTISSIDKALDEIKTEMETFEKQTDADKNKIGNVEKEIRKSCKFYNKGYCRRKESCQFLHSDLQSMSADNMQKILLRVFF